MCIMLKFSNELKIRNNSQQKTTKKLHRLKANYIIDYCNRFELSKRILKVGIIKCHVI